MTIGELIKQYRQNNGNMSQRKFASVCGVSNGYISMLEAGINPKTKEPIVPNIANISKIAKAMGLTVNELMVMADDMPIDISSPRTGALPDNVQPVNELHVHKVPIIDEIAAGQPILAEHDYETVVPGPTGADFALTVRGDSMEPTYISGDIVYLRQQDDVDDGQVAAVILDDEATLKHVVHIPNGLTLISDNPRHPPRVVTLSDYDNIRILGLVIGYTRMYN